MKITLTDKNYIIIYDRR